jgi:hypothetical protein
MDHDSSSSGHTNIQDATPFPEIRVTQPPRIPIETLSYKAQAVLPDIPVLGSCISLM